jgi:division protein CdvB (Snf7/Vps24/ESCRT-III family)
MSNFSSNWNKDQSSNYEDFGTRLKNAIKGPDPLKPRLESANRHIQVQVAKLSAKSDRLAAKDKEIFERVVSLIQKRDTQRAKMLANELTEIRKMGKLVTQAKLAFEQIELRINTIQDLGDVASTLSPALGIVKGIAPGICNVLPEAQSEIEEISGLLRGILVDSGQVNPSVVSVQAANEQAESIIAEAGAIAEQSIKDKFPDLPAYLQVQAEREEPL